MNKRLTTKKYYFSVDGETEILYFKWLMKVINEQPNITSKVSFDAKKVKPTSWAKRITITEPIFINRICDVESNDNYHRENFRKILDELSDLSNGNSKFKNKIKKCELGYTNYTFELWIILHKQQLNGHLNNRKDYLIHINSAFGKRFTSLDEFKKEGNLNQILNALTFDDLKSAIKNAGIIENNNNLNYTKKEYRNHTYYSENPSLSIHELIINILKESGIEI